MVGEEEGNWLGLPEDAYNWLMISVFTFFGPYIAAFAIFAIIFIAGILDITLLYSITLVYLIVGVVLFWILMTSSTILSLVPLFFTTNVTPFVAYPYLVYMVYSPTYCVSRLEEDGCTYLYNGRNFVHVFFGGWIILIAIFWTDLLLGTTLLADGGFEENLNRLLDLVNKFELFYILYKTFAPVARIILYILGQDPSLIPEI
jgi:hypothetical protein